MKVEEKELEAALKGLLTLIDRSVRAVEDRVVELEKRVEELERHEVKVLKEDS